MDVKSAMALCLIVVPLVCGACSKADAPKAKKPDQQVKTTSSRPAAGEGETKSAMGAQGVKPSAKTVQAKGARKLKRAGSGPPAKEVKWSDTIAWVDYKAGLAQALKEGKSVLLLVYTNW
jgi:hypothetical protein